MMVALNQHSIMFLDYTKSDKTTFSSQSQKSRLEPHPSRSIGWKVVDITYVGHNELPTQI